MEILTFEHDIMAPQKINDYIKILRNEKRISIKEHIELVTPAGDDVDASELLSIKMKSNVDIYLALQAFCAQQDTNNDLCFILRTDSNIVIVLAIYSFICSLFSQNIYTIIFPTLSIAEQFINDIKTKIKK